MQPLFAYPMSLISAMSVYSSQQMITFRAFAGVLKERQEEECRACFEKSKQGENALLILQSIALPHFLTKSALLLGFLGEPAGPMTS